MDNYIYVIVALLPLSSLTLILQVNPYQALVIRAIVGAIAALVYAVLGAADVALTEALVGTMLAIALYVVAVRSSLVMRLGILKTEGETENDLTDLIAMIRKVINQHYMRLEIVEYPNSQVLEQALLTKEVHATFMTGETEEELIHNHTTVIDVKQTSQLSIRVRRLFEIMQEELALGGTKLSYVTVPNVEEKH
ncbi:MAG: DUF4040 domain-containing protein [Halothece sp.]